MPDEIAPYVQAFVRKGEPEKLIAMVKKFSQPAATPGGE
jgi:hypothetical protein